MQLLIVVEPYLSSVTSNDIITPVAETVERMTDCLERFTRETRVRGRPSLKVPESQLSFLLSHSFSVTQIAQMFGCHRHRRIREYELESHHFTPISLDDLVQSMCTLHRRSGEKTIEGKLQSVGLQIQRERIREYIG